MATETITRGLPRVDWSAVIAGVLCALAAHIVLGLLGAALGFAAEPTDSQGVGAAAGIWGLLTPFVASLIGAWVCVRVARTREGRGAYLHGALVWCAGLIAGALFLTGTMASGMMSAATAASGNADTIRSQAERQTGRAQGRSARAAPDRGEQAADEAGKRAAAGSGFAGIAALLGLAGAAAGSALGRREVEGRHGHGKGLFDRSRRGDERRETTVASTSPEATVTPTGVPPAGHTIVTPPGPPSPGVH